MATVTLQIASTLHSHGHKFELGKPQVVSDDTAKALEEYFEKYFKVKYDGTIPAPVQSVAQEKKKGGVIIKTAAPAVEPEVKV